MAKIKVLVTGGAGFIGSHQVDALIGKGYDVVIVDDLSIGSLANVNPKAKLFQNDIRDTAIEEIFAKEIPEYVFHFAAQASVNRSVDDPIFDASVNIIGSLNILNNGVKHKIKKIMFSSTGGAIYGDADIVPTPESFFPRPESPYGIAKLTVENYLRYFHKQFNLEYGILRYANVYGSRQESHGEAGVIPIFIEKLLKGESPVIFGDGYQTRDFVHVSDVVSANMKVFESESVDIYNVGTGRQTTVNELFQLLKNELAPGLHEKHADKFTGVPVSCLSYSKINQDLGWEPKVDLIEGLEETIEWMKHK